MRLFLMPLAIVLLLAMPAAAVISKYKTGKKARWAVIANLCGFFAVLAIAFFMPVGDLIALAADGEQAAAAVASSAEGMKYLAAALATGLGSIGCGIAVAAAAPAAIGAVAEDPKSFVKALIFVAMGEGVAIYGLLISILIING